MKPLGVIILLLCCFGPFYLASAQTKEKLIEEIETILKENNKVVVSLYGKNRFLIQKSLTILPNLILGEQFGLERILKFSLIKNLWKLITHLMDIPSKALRLCTA